MFVAWIGCSALIWESVGQTKPVQTPKPAAKAKPSTVSPRKSPIVGSRVQNAKPKAAEDSFQLILLKDRFITIEENFAGGKVDSHGKIYTVQMKLVGRLGVQLMNTYTRALPFQVEYPSSNSLFNYAVNGLGVGSKRVFAEPETGHFCWVEVIGIRPLPIENAGVTDGQ